MAAVVALVESAYRGESSRRGWTTEADFLDGQRTDHAGVREALARVDGLILLAEDERGVAACMQLEQRSEACHFGLFAVRPAGQGLGLGGALLDEAERYARERWRAREMRMEVISIRIELIDWYRRRGYRETGETLPFPYGDERFGLPRREDLRFMCFHKRLTSEV